MIIHENTQNFLASFGELSVGDVFKDEMGDGLYYMRVGNINDGYQDYNCVNLHDGGLDCFSNSATVRKINTAKLVVE